jgi:hypothetical protein
MTQVLKQLPRITKQHLLKFDPLMAEEVRYRFERQAQLGRGSAVCPRKNYPSSLNPFPTHRKLW